jgi:hypothetical protein
MTKPDWKALAIGLMAHAKSLSREASAPNWMDKGYAVIQKKHLAGLDGAIERIEEAIKSECGVNVHVGVPQAIGTPPAGFTHLGVNPQPTRLETIEKAISALDLTLAGVTRNMARMDRQLINVDHNYAAIMEIVLPKKPRKVKKGKKP